MYNVNNISVWLGLLHPQHTKQPNYIEHTVDTVNNISYTKLINMHEALSHNAGQGHQGHFPQCQGHLGQPH